MFRFTKRHARGHTALCLRPAETAQTRRSGPPEGTRPVLLL